MRKNKGFTLIEILITITIIGVLSSITIFSYKNYVSVSNEASTKQELVQLYVSRLDKIKKKEYNVEKHYREKFLWRKNIISSPTVAR